MTEATKFDPGVSLRQYPIAAFDVETTGLAYESCRIVELGAVKIVNGVRSTFSALVNPGVPIPKEASNVNHITDDMVKGAKPIAEVLPAFLDFMAGGVWVAHNSSFDVGFLAVEMQRCKTAFPTNPVLCSLRMARSVYQGAGVDHHLRSAYSVLFPDKKIDEAPHRAEIDAGVCLDITLALLGKKSAGNSAPLVNVVEWAGSPLGFADHDIVNAQMAFEHERMVKGAMLKHPRVVVAYTRWGGIAMATGKPVAYTRDDRGSRVLVVDQDDGTSVGVRFETIRSVEPA